MRVAIICNDTRGGLQPYLALGVGLRAAGHEALMVAPRNFGDFVRSFGLEFRGLEGDVQALLESPEHAGIGERGFLAAHRLMIEMLGRSLRDWTRDALEACRGADLILGGIGGQVVGEGVAEKLGVPFVQAHVQPLTTTAEYSGVLMPDWLRGRFGPLDRLSHGWSRQVFWQPMRPAVNAARRSVLGLGPARFLGNVGRPGRDGVPMLHGYSRHLLPRPAGWPANVHVTGYWFLDPDPSWSPPADLAAFLDQGPPPVAVGFGSMSGRDAEANTALVLEAAGRAGRRIVLLSGWGGLSRSDLPESAFLVDSVPHAWLFPRVAASVHHGGAGTTGATLRAGIPSVIVPFGADQPFWAWLVADRGLGAPPIPRRRLTAASLARALTSVLEDASIRERAAAMGERIRREDGVGRAVEILDGFLRRGPRPRVAGPSAVA